MKRLARGGLSWDVVEAEIGKCEVRCANCHRRRTAVQLGAYRLKMRPGEIRTRDSATPEGIGPSPSVS